MANEIIKNGISESTSFTLSFDQPLNSRKRDREIDTSVSYPPSSHPRLNDPSSPTLSSTCSTRSLHSTHTVKTQSTRPTVSELRKNTQDTSTMKLRSYLDHHVSAPSQASMSFDVAFSPPKAKREIPKRFQAQRTTRSKPTVPEDRRQTVVKSKKTLRKK